MGMGKESLFAASGSHDQDDHHAYMVKTLQKSSQEPVDQFPRNLVCSMDSGQSKGDSGQSKFVQMMTRLTMTYFTARSNLIGCVFELGKL